MKLRIWPTASATPKTAATEVFFSSAIWTLASGGTDARKACGRIDLGHHASEGKADRAGRLGLAERDGVDA